MVVVAALGRAFGVAARPGGHIDREHRRVAIGQVASEQVTQPLGVDPTAGSRLRCGSDGIAWAHSSASLNSNSASARRSEAGMQLGPKLIEPRRGKVGIGMAAQPASRDRSQAT
jgi:hypothetical protein